MIKNLVTSKICQTFNPLPICEASRALGGAEMGLRNETILLDSYHSFNIKHLKELNRVTQGSVNNQSCSPNLISIKIFSFLNQLQFDAFFFQLLNTHTQRMVNDAKCC